MGEKEKWGSRERNTPKPMELYLKKKCPQELGWGQTDAWSSALHYGPIQVQQKQKHFITVCCFLGTSAKSWNGSRVART